MDVARLVAFPTEKEEPKSPRAQYFLHGTRLAGGCVRGKRFVPCDSGCVQGVAFLLFMLSVDCGARAAPNK